MLSSDRDELKAQLASVATQVELLKGDGALQALRELEALAERERLLPFADVSHSTCSSLLVHRSEFMAFLRGIEQKPFLRDYLREDASLNVAELHAHNERTRRKIEEYEASISDNREQLRAAKAREEEFLTQMIQVDQRREGSWHASIRTISLSQSTFIKTR